MVAGAQHQAEDLAHDALERAIRALPGFDPGRGSVDAWLWRIVVNAAADAGRVERRRWRLMERLTAVHPTADELVPGVEVGDDGLLTAIRQLPSRQRAVIALRYGADLDWSSVAQALGTTSAAARSLNHRALTQLRTLLHAGGFDS
jgi:RNA polymerase sigma-70 factor (ECF subfamily)